MVRRLSSDGAAAGGGGGARGAGSEWKLSLPGGGNVCLVMAAH